MKIILNAVPFLLAHGGQQIQIEQTIAALKQIGMDVDYVRWWDGFQSADILHNFGPPVPNHIALAKKKGMKVVFSDLLSAKGARPPAVQTVNRIAFKVLRAVLPRVYSDSICSGSYLTADACIALTPWEAHLMEYVFGAPKEKIHVVPNGVEDFFFEISEPSPARGPWLICTATIYPLKRIVELSRAAVEAKTPLWIIGKPYSEDDSYYQEFIRLANQHQDIIRYEGEIADRRRLASIYREARGFVLLSNRESRSLSAEEAAASGCPLLLSDLPWSRSVFGDSVRYCPLPSTVREIVPRLREFYDAAPRIPAAPRPNSWVEVAEQLRTIYTKVLS